MSWTPALHCQFPDEATAREFAAALGVDFPEDGSIPTGNHNFALVAPIEEWITRPVYVDGEMVDPGERRSGFWAMLRLNTDWPGFAATLAAIEAAGVVRELAEPCNVFA